MRINYNQLTENLPDAFAKEENSNNYKLLSIKKAAFDSILRSIQDLFSIQNIDNAKGKVLDNIYGALLQQPRGFTENADAADAQYLIKLKGKIAQNISDGTFPVIIEVLAYLAKCEANEIKFIENEQALNEVILKAYPMTVFENADLTVAQVVELVNNLLPANVSVTLDPEVFTGSFEFAEFENEYDPNKGFGNIEQTVGGTLGMLI